LGGEGRARETYIESRALGKKKGCDDCMRVLNTTFRGGNVRGLPEKRPKKEDWRGGATPNRKGKACKTSMKVTPGRRRS